MVRPVWGRPRRQTKGKCYTLTNSFCPLLWRQTDSNNHSTIRPWRVFVPQLKPMCAQQKRPRACRVYLMCEGTRKEPAADGPRSRFPSEPAAFVHTYLPAYTCMHTMRSLFAVDLCLVHTCSALGLFFFFFFFPSTPGLWIRAPGLRLSRQLLTFYAVFVFTPRVLFTSLAPMPRSTKDLTLKQQMRRGEEKRGRKRRGEKR